MRQYIVCGFNAEDEIFDNKPLVTALGSTNIEGIVLAETFLDIVNKEFLDDLKQYDYLIIIDSSGQLYFRTILEDNNLKVSVCSLDDKVKIFGGLIGYNYLADKLNKEEENDMPQLPKIPIEKLEVEMIEQQNAEINDKIKKRFK